MRLVLASCFIWVISLGVGAANPLVDQLRLQIRSGENIAARKTVALADQQFRQGKISADDLRDVFIHLSRSHPMTVDFVDQWAADEPRNPHALIARAWSLFSAARNVRTGRNEYSRQVAGAMFADSAQLATDAFRLDPELIPASDAMVRGLGRPATTFEMPQKVLARVMKDQPNWGSLTRAIVSSRSLQKDNPWQTCIKYTSQISDDDLAKKIRHQCRMKLSSASQEHQIRSYGLKHLWTDKDPATASSRLHLFFVSFAPGEATKEQLTQVREMLTTPAYDQFMLPSIKFFAGKFDSIYTLEFPELHLGVKFERAHQTVIEQALDDDPYDLFVLDLWEGVPFQHEMVAKQLDDDTYTFEAQIPEMTTEEEQNWFRREREHREDFAKRRVKASPYSPSAWYNLSLALRTGGKPKDMFEGDLALQNAAVFKDDPIAIYREIMVTKLQQIDMLQMIDEDAIQMPPEWQDAAKTINRGEQILCPFLRAYRLREAACKAFFKRGELCESGSPEQEAAFETMANLARSNASCAGVLGANIDDLYYQAVPYDVAVPK